MTYALRDSGASLIVYDASSSILMGQVRMRSQGVIGIECRELSMEGDFHGPAMDFACADDPLAIFYTSGTTGPAKGVLLSHRNMVVQAEAKCSYVQYGSETRYLHGAPMFHLGGFNSAVAIVLAGGLQVFQGRFEPQNYVSGLGKFDINTIVAVPTMLNALVDSMEASHGFGSVKTILYGGNAISSRLLKEVYRKFPRAAIIQAYGMTETASSMTFLYHDRLDLSFDSCAGRAADHVELAILTNEGPTLIPGKIGEIITRGPQVMLGYWNRPRETQNALLKDGWFRTGDLGRFDLNGLLFLEGRLRDMIKTGGEAVLSLEVERILASHPSVGQVAVLGLPDPRWGEMVTAVIRIRPESAGIRTSKLQSDLLKLCHDKLARFKAPRRFIFVSDGLPVNAAGKIMKPQLRSMIETSLAKL